MDWESFIPMGMGSLQPNRFLLNWHKSLRKEIYKLRQSYFLNSDSMLLVPLTNSYIELEKINKEHIDDLIEICTDSQRMEFKDFIKEQNLFSPNMNKKQ